MLSEADWSEAVRTAGQQRDDDMHKGDPVGKIRPEKVRTQRQSHSLLLNIKDKYYQEFGMVTDALFRLVTPAVPEPCH